MIFFSLTLYIHFIDNMIPDSLISSRIPRYEPIPLSPGIPRVSLIYCLTFSGILLPKSKIDLSKLMH